jgi:HPt (histidine-containing phosphotransfer) domain-containing protein
VAGTEASQPRNTPESATVLFDRVEALARVEGDTELLVDLIDIFFDIAGPMMEAIRAAVATNDPVKLEKAAHRLKGSVSIFGAHTVSETAFELEKMGRAGNLSRAADTLGQLEQQAIYLKLSLKQFYCELRSSS